MNLALDIPLIIYIIFKFNLLGGKVPFGVCVEFSKRAKE